VCIDQLFLLKHYIIALRHALKLYKDQEQYKQGPESVSQRRVGLSTDLYPDQRFRDMLVPLCSTTLVFLVINKMAKLNLFAKNGKKIVGVAANYKSLLKVLNKPMPKVPGIFLKPTTSYITEEQTIIIPQGFSVNEEVELGVIIGKRAKKEEARRTGGSWTLGKGFDTATPVGAFMPKSDIPDPHNVTLWCSVNGERCQDGCTSDMAFDVSDLISYISNYITLEPNDLILSGSPPGMGPVRDGDVIEAGITGLTEIKFCVRSDI
ncbi:hypothetical protein NQ318_006516, partial [Aromia moschata]